jgi:hypothetical protein
MSWEAFGVIATVVVAVLTPLVWLAFSRPAGYAKAYPDLVWWCLTIALSLLFGSAVQIAMVVIELLGALRETPEAPLRMFEKQLSQLDRAMVRVPIVSVAWLVVRFVLYMLRDLHKLNDPAKPA